MTSRRRFGRRSAVGYLLSAVLVCSSCPKEPPRPKVANPMIDSAEKFTVVYTESIPTQTGLDAFVGILGGRKDTADTAAGKDTAGNQEEVKSQESRVKAGVGAESTGEAKSESKVSQDSADKTQGQEGARVLLVPDTVEPVYNPGTVEMICLVHYVGVEGGFWGLTAENAQNYDPLNLPDKLKYGGLRVRFWLRMRKDIATSHMWGTPVQIVAYSFPKK